MDDAFGREGGRRMEMGRLVERVNELTAHRYELAQEISKQDPVLDKYTDHGPEHIKEVATNTLEYSQAFREFAQSQVSSREAKPISSRMFCSRRRCTTTPVWTAAWKA